MIDLKDKKAVIFDMDGLLIDSEPFWDKAHKAFFAKYQLQDSKTIRELTHGAGVQDNIRLFKKQLGLQGEVSVLADEYRQFFYAVALADGVLQLMPGAKHLLHCLSENGYRLAIATGGYTERKINEILQRLTIGQFFPTHVSSDIVEKGKPDPAVYQKTAEILHLKQSACIVLEDSVNGVTSGKAAGMLTIGVNKDRSYQKKLLLAGADIIVERLDDLIPLFAGACCGTCQC